MPAIFLSASVPTPTRNRQFMDSVDRIAIRDAIRALVTVIGPATKLVFGGHPAITPMIRRQLHDKGADVRDRFTVFQSAYFEREFVSDLRAFQSVVVTPAVDNDAASSLKAMRTAMLASERFDAAVFIGGMDGLYEEHQMFLKSFPRSTVLAIASTGAAAKTIFERSSNPNRDLLTDRHYLSLFRRYLPQNTLRRTTSGS